MIHQHTSACHVMRAASHAVVLAPSADQHTCCLGQLNNQCVPHCISPNQLDYCHSDKTTGNFLTTREVYSGCLRICVSVSYLCLLCVYMCVSIKYLFPYYSKLFLSSFVSYRSHTSPLFYYFEICWVDDSCKKVC